MLPFLKRLYKCDNILCPIQRSYDIVKERLKRWETITTRTEKRSETVVIKSNENVCDVRLVTVKSNTKDIQDINRILRYTRYKPNTKIYN